jgi:hypothetical protein
VADQPDPPLGGQRPQLGAEDDVVGGGRGVHQDDVSEIAPGGLVHVVAQHAHHRGDPGPGGDEQRLRRALRGEDELTGGLVQLHDGARPGAADQVVAHLAVGDGLDRDGEAAVGAAEDRGDRVGPPQPDAVDVDADPHVLARGVRQPVAAGADHDRRGVPGLGQHGLDPPAQRRAGAQRVDQVEVVGGQQRRGDQLGDLQHPVAQPAQHRTGRRRTGDGCGHALSMPIKDVAQLTSGRESGR